MLPSLPIMVYSFCSGCICRLESCVHILPGKITKVFPYRKTNNYSIGDVLDVGIPLIVLLVFPQFWIWKNKPFLIGFWLLFGVTIIDIKLFVCKKCKNEKCLFFPSG